MTGSYQDVADEAARHAARLEGELAAVRDQLAAAVATEEQLRHELDTYRADAAAARAELADVQHQTNLRVRFAEQQVEELRERLDEAKRLVREAEEQRAAVIAAMGRRARRGLVQTGDG